ncbi:PorT family protein [Flaviaesturariibacter flavus]|uniref:PorT family protein n=1 Tax=Flaviaesturariibacter flavus TaxID=2502780 RepID=A0A4R1BIR2_9BACT|nr:outer membrane beta-barrel protein [Flaviaesturariibacter flavus]TCJ17058.1 PorT family protein [Flaviaesturariibacter flavus]
MRKLFLAALGLCLSGVLFAQSDSSVKRSILSSRGLPKGNDHFMIQVGYTQWAGRPDTISTTGIPRSLNIYFMLAFPFRTNPHWSAAIGVGVGSDNIYFKNTDIRIRDVDTRIKFIDVSNTQHYKKYKLTTDYLEAPVELRFSSHPNDDNRSLKFALGAKVGLLLNAKTKGRTLLNGSGDTINEYKEKEVSKKFFNRQRLVATGRVSYGHFGIFATYQVSQVFKENMGPDVHPFTIGVALSGL